MERKHIALALAAMVLGGSMALAGERPAPPPRMGGCGPGMEQREDGDTDGSHCGMMMMRGPGRHRGPGGPGGMEQGRQGMGMMGMGHGMGMGQGMGMGMAGPRMIRELDLTAEQKAKALDVMTASFRAGMEARMALADARDKVEALSRDDSATPDAIVAANRELGEAKGKLMAQRKQAREHLRSILTDEQKAKLDKFREDRGDRGPRGFDRGHGPRRFDRDHDGDRDGRRFDRERGHGDRRGWKGDRMMAPPPSAADGQPEDME